MYKQHMVVVRTEVSGLHSSLTQTTVLRGDFKEVDATKKEFMDNIKLQQEFAKD